MPSHHLDHNRFIVDWTPVNKPVKTVSKTIISIQYLHLKMLSAKFHPFSISLNELTILPRGQLPFLTISPDISTNFRQGPAAINHVPEVQSYSHPMLLYV